MQRDALILLCATGIGVACLAGCAHHTASSPYASPYTSISGSNVQGLAVDANNRLMTSVEICVPGTSDCQTIPNIVVDTGSSGLRLFAAQLSLPLPSETLADGDPLAECTQFPGLYDWGWVGTADILIGNEKASAAPVQVIADANFPGVPFACSSTGLPANDSAQTFGANGVLGVGVLQYDCGADCASGTGTTLSYYDCSKTTGDCASAPAELAQQVQNPVALFATDNNGVIISLPDVDDSGSSDITGTLTFGIGTESNNAIASSVPVYTTNSSGDLAASYNSTSYGTSYLASGLPYTGMLDSLLIQNDSDCPYGGAEQGYYCPANTIDASVTVTGTNAAASSGSSSSTVGTGTVTVAIADASTLLSNSTYTAFDDLAGPAPSAVIFGLPFFFGRNVYVAISGQSTTAGAGPYFAF